MTKLHGLQSRVEYPGSIAKKSVLVFTASVEISA
jgi:hypothetical protein